MAENNNMNGKDFLLGAVFGAVVGAATALLLAPKAGKELRKDLSDGYHTVAEKTTTIAGEVGQKTQAVAGQVRDMSTEWAGKAKEATTSVVDDLKAWRDSRKQSAVTAEDGTVAEETPAVQETAATEENTAAQETAATAEETLK